LVSLRTRQADPLQAQSLNAVFRGLVD